jgi:tetratricopeptide (TPR) repeat protein
MPHPSANAPEPEKTQRADRTPEPPNTLLATGTPEAGALTPACTVPVTPPTASAAPPGTPHVPGYEITGEIARGGMGRVLAGRELALDREVAIKVLLPGADATRFVTEARITARLPHPSIPPVHALGTLPDGSPFLAMKRIHGRTLASLLTSQERPGLPYLMQIFEPICQAVGFAHSRGIIHRDLKPANVMVGEFGEVQVMDWGLAKDVASRRPEPGPSTAHGEPVPDEVAAHTRAGAIMGTPAFMAPEQARGEVVDARADVFALGAILTYLLTGKFVYTGTDAREVVRRAAAGDTQDALRQLDASGADAELVAIAKRCLAVNPADGQAVAVQVAAYRQGVEARLRRAETEKAQALVREGEQRKRRRVILGATLALALVLLAGLAASLWQMNRAIAAERAEAQRADAEQQAKVQAQENLAFARKGYDLLASVFKGLDPKANYTTLADFREGLKRQLGKAVGDLDAAASVDPLTVATVQITLGRLLLGLGEAPLGIELFEKARSTRTALLGPDHPETAIATGNLADAYTARGNLRAALPLYEETLRRLREQLGPDHSETLISMNNLAASYYDAGQLDKALPLYEETLALQKAKLGANHRDTLATMNNLAGAYQALGRIDKAQPLFEAAFKIKKTALGPEHPSTLTSMTNLALTYQITRQFDVALPLYEEALRLRKAVLGVDHPDTLGSMHNLAAGYEAAGQHAKALPLYEETRQRMAARLGKEHPATLTSANNLASCYQGLGQFDKAVPLFEETLRLRQEKLGPDHPETLISMNNLAEAFRVSGQAAKAVPLFEETLRLRREKLGPQHPDTIFSMGNLGAAYGAVNQGEKAAPLLLEFVAGQRSRFPKEHPRFAGLLAQVAFDLLKCQQFGAAETLLRESLAIREKKEPGEWTTFNTMSLLGGALAGQKKYAEAEPLLRTGYEGLLKLQKSIPPQGSTRISEARDRLIQLYTVLNQPDELKKYQTSTWTAW